MPSISLGKCIGLHMHMLTHTHTHTHTHTQQQQPKLQIYIGKQLLLGVKQWDYHRIHGSFHLRVKDKSTVI